MLCIRDNTPHTMGLVTVAQQDGDAPLILSSSQYRKKRRKAMFARYAIAVKAVTCLRRRMLPVVWCVKGRAA